MSFALSQEDVKSLSEDQISAIFDALAAAAWADGTVSQVEKDRFEAEIGKLPWGKPQDELVKIIGASVQRVVALKDREGVLKFIDGIAKKITDQNIRAKVVYTMGTITFADKDMSEPEKNVLKAFTAAFNLSPEQVAALSTQIKSGN